MFALVRHAGYSIQSGSIDDQGRLASKKLEEDLRTVAPWRAVVSSPITRAVETANILAEPLQLPVSMDDDLAPDQDASAYRPSSELKALDRCIIVSHAPILNDLIARWARHLGIQKPEPLNVAQAYVIDLDQKRILII